MPIGGDGYSTHEASTAMFRNIYNTVKAYDSSKMMNICLPGMTSVSGFSGGYAGYRSDNRTVCELMRLGDAWTYEPYERFDVMIPDGTTKSYGRFSRNNCTWDSEFQVFPPFPRRCGRFLHPLLPGRGLPRLLGERGGLSMESPGDVYVIPWAGRSAAMGMAAETGLTIQHN